MLIMGDASVDFFMCFLKKDFIHKVEFIIWYRCCEQQDVCTDKNERCILKILCPSLAILIYILLKVISVCYSKVWLKLFLDLFTCLIMIMLNWLILYEVNISIKKIVNDIFCRFCANQNLIWIFINYVSIERVPLIFSSSFFVQKRHPYGFCYEIVFFLFVQCCHFSGTMINKLY